MSDFSLDNYLNQPQYNDIYTQEMIRSAYFVIDGFEAWSIIRNFGSDPNNRFMWSDSDEITKIMTSINKEYGGHSGASLALLMRNMHQISLLK